MIAGAVATGGRRAQLAGPLGLVVALSLISGPALADATAAEDALLRTAFAIRFFSSIRPDPEIAGLKASEGRAERDGPLLTLHLRSGRDLRYETKGCAEHQTATSCQEFGLIAHLASRDAFILRALEPQSVSAGLDYLFIDGTSGDTTQLEDIPFVSNSGRTLAISHDGWKFEKFGGLSIYERTGGRVTKAWSGESAPCRKANTRMTFIASVSDEAVTAECIFNPDSKLGRETRFTVRKTRAGWRLDPSLSR